MEELIGKKCTAYFDQEPALYTGWKLFPASALVVVLGVDMPMVKMKRVDGVEPFWVNVRHITTINLAEFDASQKEPQQ